VEEGFTPAVEHNRIGMESRITISDVSTFKRGPGTCYTVTLGVSLSSGTRQAPRVSMVRSLICCLRG
jgi:hypothetical protein